MRFKIGNGDSLPQHFRVSEQRDDAHSASTLLRIERKIILVLKIWEHASEVM